MMSRKRAHGGLALIIAIYLLLGIAHSILLPLHKAADEIAHFQYSRFIARTGRLPLTYEERDEAGYKAYQPPLYHVLVAALTGWSNSNGPPYLKFVWESPRFDLARELLDTKRLANTEDELLPYRGTVLMWHLGRLVTLLIGCGVILTTFYTTLALMPGNYRLATVSAAIIAFVPAFIFYSSVMSYEPLVALLIGLYFLLLVKIIKGDHRLVMFAGLGLLMGLAVMAKYVAIVLPLEVVFMISLLAYRQDWPWSVWFARLSVTALAAVLIASGWFLFLITNFNEIDELGPVMGVLKPIMAGGGDTTQNYITYQLSEGEIGAVQRLEIVREPFWGWVLQTFQTFWAEKVGSFPLEPVAFIAAGLLCGLAAVGWLRVWQRQPEKRIWLVLFIVHLATFLILPLTRFAVQGRLAQTAQGRHILFAVATVLPAMLVYGWPLLFSRRQRQRAALAVVGGLLLWSLVQLGYIQAVYKSLHLPVQTGVAMAGQITHPLRQAFGDRIYLLGYGLDLGESALDMSLYWQNTAYPDEDYRRRIQLLQGEQVVLEWDDYPAQGRYPTRIWETWETIRDDLSLPLAGLPAGKTEVRLQLYGRQGAVPVAGQDYLALGTIYLPSPASVPSENELPIRVDGREVVQGFTLWQANQWRGLHLPTYTPRMSVPLLWHGQPDETERVEWLLVDPQNRVYLAQPASPRLYHFIVGPDWPAGDYRLRVEVWRDEAVVASRETQPLITVDNERPRLRQPPPISHPLAVNFANRVKLLGYDLPLRTLASGQGVPVTLYWQGLRTMGQSYTVFAKLLNHQQHQWGSIDRYPADGYQTFYWLENEVVIDGFELPVQPDIPDGVYWLNVGLYQTVNGAAVSLPIVLDQAQSEVTSVTFGPVKIGGPPPGMVVSEASPQKLVNAVFGDQIKLLGVDFDTSEITNLRIDELTDYSANRPLHKPNIQRTDSTGSFDLTFYWQSLARTDADYTVFIHIKNRQEELVAQLDQPPAGNLYPTSVWSPGEIIPDQVTVPLPDTLPAGTYTVSLGLYELDTGARLWLAESSDNSLQLAEFELE